MSELVVHETVTTSYDATMRALRSKRLGVQFIVAPDGRISQHGDAVTDMQEHVGAHNGPSVGVEVVTPYYPTSLPKGGPWAHVIEAPWAHRGRYVLPTPESCEALVQLVAWITTGNVRGLEVPRAWVGYDDKSHTFRLTQLRDPSPRPGVWSHQQIGGHADGSWLALYALLRIRWRLAPADARDAAATVATGCRGLVYLDRVVPVAPAAP